MINISPPAPARRGVSKEQFWRKVLQRFHASGQSVRQFCRTAQLSEPSFYAWRRTLAQRDTASAPVKSSEPVFLPEQVTAQRTGRIEIVLGGGQRVRLTGPVDPLALEQVLLVLSAVSQSVPALSLSNGRKGKEGMSC